MTNLFYGSGLGIFFVGKGISVSQICYRSSDLVRQVLWKFFLLREWFTFDGGDEI